MGHVRMNWLQKASALLAAIALALLVAALTAPKTAEAADLSAGNPTKVTEGTSLAISNPRITNAGSDKIETTHDLVYFGNYPMKAGGSSEPILWRVLSVSNNEALLLSEYTIYEKMNYHNTLENVTWNTCDLRQWLNGIVAYSGKGYIDKAFTANERKLLQTIDGDKVTLLTAEDAMNTAYGFGYQDYGDGTAKQSSTRATQPSDKVDNANPKNNKVGWLLRKKESSQSVNYVSYLGRVGITKGYVANYAVNYASKAQDFDCYYARPVIKVKLDSSIQYAGTVSVHGEGYYVGDTTVYDILDTPQSVINELKVTISPTSAAYTGKQIKPSVTVKFNGQTLKKGTDYTVSYSNNINVGKGKVTVKSTGARFNTETREFKIVPKTPAISSLAKGKKAFTVKAKKQAKNTTTGWQINYKVKGASKWKSKTVKSTKALSKKVSGLNAKKTYQVRVRTYKTVGKTTYYSAWSKTKAVKTK